MGNPLCWNPGGTFLFRSFILPLMTSFPEGPAVPPCREDLTLNAAMGDGSHLRWVSCHHYWEAQAIKIKYSVLTSFPHLPFPLTEEIHSCVLPAVLASHRPVLGVTSHCAWPCYTGWAPIYIQDHNMSWGFIFLGSKE